MAIASNMEISENFTNLFTSESSTGKADVPIIAETQKYLKEVSGIGLLAPVFPTVSKDINIDISKTLPKDLPSEEQMSSMPFNELKGLREKHTGNRMVQNYIAPYEHRAMNREIVPSGGILNGLLQTSALSVATPTYALAKSQKLLPEDVDTSNQYASELKQGFIGIGEGLKALFIPEEKPQQKESIPKEKPKDTITSLIENLIQTESSGRHRVDGELLTSPAGAKGITQVMYRTGKNPGYGIKPLQSDSEEEYIRFGKDYVTKMIQVFDDIEQGVAAYNAGPGVIHRAIAKAERTGKHWKEFIPKETKKYIEKVVPKKEEEKIQPHKPEITDIMGFRG